MVFILRFAFYGVFFVRKGAPVGAPYSLTLYHQMKFAGAVCSCQANELRDTGMSRLRKINRLCSSKLSVNREYFTKDTQK